ncbi:MAG: tRNA preQ1(34) S-adenosylmethionine ribosyltransferase-isomerase QueA [Chloroflexi bacterium]|nr:tRNA preQ1(34) S-adenosylmethionine ribosyltransferase-isomerase QueA [Chloroflexota bacterium]
MLTSDFDYQLPSDLIAQTPIEPRDAARLLVVDRATGALVHRQVSDLPELLRPGDLLVVNRTRVLPARLHARRVPSGGRVELLLLLQQDPRRWQVLARPARRLPVGTALRVEPSGPTLTVVAVGEAGLREVLLEADPSAEAKLLAAGSVPLPPYIHGYQGDPERYQTIFASEPGSAAAPTAGLHFTSQLVRRLEAAGVELAEIVLHVGLDTFRPVLEEDPSRHRMHREWYQVPGRAQAQLGAARADGRRVVAVGTTSVRTLETWAASGRAEGWSELFIRPGYTFQGVDALLTNFHLPRSTLLMLVSAFATPALIRAAYASAIAQRYRFYSFGDAMLIT